MLTSDAGQLEVTELEAWLDAECPCEAVHTETVCSIAVVAVATWCKPGRYMVCQVSANVTLKRIASGEWSCSGCKRSAFDCWRIIPI